MGIFSDNNEDVESKQSRFTSADGTFSKTEKTDASIKQPDQSKEQSENPEFEKGYKENGSGDVPEEFKKLVDELKDSEKRIKEPEQTPELPPTRIKQPEQKLLDASNEVPEEFKKLVDELKDSEKRIKEPESKPQRPVETIPEQPEVPTKSTIKKIEQPETPSESIIKEIDVPEKLSTPQPKQPETESDYSQLISAINTKSDEIIERLDKTYDVEVAMLLKLDELVMPSTEVEEFPA